MGKLLRLAVIFTLVTFCVYAQNPNDPNFGSYVAQLRANLISGYCALTGCSLSGKFTVSTTGNDHAVERYRSDLSPSSVDPTLLAITTGLGNNSTFKGVSGGYEQSADDASVVTGTKGVLYGHQFSVRPLISRNNSPADDVVGVVVSNDSPNASSGTEALYVGHNSGFGTSKEWGTAGLGTDANGDNAFYGTGYYGVGVHFCRPGACAHITQGPIASPLITHANNDVCDQGVIAWDVNYIYVCTASNTWKRAALSAF